MRALAILLATFAAGTAHAQSSQPGVPSPEAANARATAPRAAAQPGAAPQPTTADVAGIRVNQLVIFGDEQCPPSTGDQINVCAKVPPSERYRIPERLRGDPDAPENQSWTNKAIELSYVGRDGIGSCSPTGPGGFTGCNQQLINQAVAERRGRPEVNWARLIEQAREERLAGIGAAAADAERAAGGNRRVQELRVREGQTCPPSTEAVIIVCTLPDGRPAPQQEPGQPELPVVGGRLQPSVPQQPQRPQRPQP